MGLDSCVLLQILRHQINISIGPLISHFGSRHFCSKSVLRKRTVRCLFCIPGKTLPHAAQGMVRRPVELVMDSRFDGSEATFSSMAARNTEFDPTTGSLAPATSQWSPGVRAPHPDEKVPSVEGEQRLATLRAELERPQPPVVPVDMSAEVERLRALVEQLSKEKEDGRPEVETLLQARCFVHSSDPAVEVQKVRVELMDMQKERDALKAALEAQRNCMDTSGPASPGTRSLL